MSLERKDVKPRFYPEDHDRLRIISEHDGLGMGEWIEQLVLREIARRYAEAVAASSLAERLGASDVPGKTRESQGALGKSAGYVTPSSLEPRR